MTQTTDVAVQEDGGVPELVTPTREARGGLSSRHITLPRLYKGEDSSNAVKAHLVKSGTIYVAQGSEDPDPIVLAEKPFTDETEGDTLRMHVLAVKLGLSRKVQGRPLETWEYNDPRAPYEDNVRETFEYTVVLPDYEDGQIPVKVLLSSTSTQTAKRMNFVLLRLDDESRWPEVAFDLSLKKVRKTEGGKTDIWYVWQARVVEAKTSDVELAKAVSEQFNVQGDVTRPASSFATVTPAPAI